MQLQKAVLYYHNPLEFEYFINSEQFYTGIELDKKADYTTEEMISEKINETAIAPVAETITAEPELITEPETIGEEDDLQVTEELKEPETEIAAAVAEEQDFEQPGLEQSITEDEVVLNFASEEEQPVYAEQAVEEQHTAINDAQEQLQTDVTEPIPNQDINTIETQSAEKTPDAVNAPSTLNLKLQTPNLDSATALSFEPYHAVDYFASQGIKLSQEEAGKDKFGKQLKSFTEWLKAMKRIPAPEGQKPETASEKKVQHLAEDSIHKADVVTEAMAEVWLKQGNREKAIETYNKLSLHNPSKKAYFAAKIDHLKST
jgi:hypothetical protein